MIKVTFYGPLADVMGRERMLEPPRPELSVGEAIDLLRAGDSEFGNALLRMRVRYAVNNSIVDAAFAVKPGDEIAVLPPFSGG